MGYPEFSIVFYTVIAVLLMSVTHGMLPWENFDLRCSGKFWFKMLRNALQWPCFCVWKDNTCKRPGRRCTNLIWRPYFNVAVMLQSIVIVPSFCGLLTSCSFWQLEPKKGTLQKQLTVNTLHMSFTQKGILLFAFDRWIDLVVEALWQP